jgi:G:T/U-mismatch repair DNA glycosylase
MPLHILPDQLQPGLRIISCGTAAGAASAKKGAYYAGPGNKFWNTLHAIGLTTRVFPPKNISCYLQKGSGSQIWQKAWPVRMQTFQMDAAMLEGCGAKSKRCNLALSRLMARELRPNFLT